jgi:exonuclease III
LKEEPTIIMLNEHWLCSFEVKKFCIKNYKIVSYFGRRKRERGGELILLRKNQKFASHKIKTPSIEMQFETCGIELQIAEQKITIITVYRPSNNKESSNFNLFSEHMENLIDQFLCAGKELIVLGDLNVDLISGSTDAKNLTDMMHSYELFIATKLGRKMLSPLLL